MKIITDQFEHAIMSLTRTLQQSSFDTQMLLDNFLSIILVVCISYSCRLLLLSTYCGPLLVALTFTAREMHRLIFFVFICIIAYHTVFLTLFAYYNHQQSYGDEQAYHSNVTTRARIALSFHCFGRRSINIFFSLFGSLQNELTQNYRNTSTNHTLYYPLNSLTLIFGSTTYGSFITSLRIFLTTLIIAHVKHAYYSTQKQEINNWYYFRTKYIMEFIDGTCNDVPVPLNILPTPRHVRVYWQSKRVRKNFIDRTHLSTNIFLRHFDYDSLADYRSNQGITSNDVINRIVARFLYRYHRIDSSQCKHQRQKEYKDQLLTIRMLIINTIQLIRNEQQLIYRKVSHTFGFDRK
jgi:hypothetical protein